jgi:uncharacterized membrane protein
VLVTIKNNHSQKTYQIGEAVTVAAKHTNHFARGRIKHANAQIISGHSQQFILRVEDKLTDADGL